MDPKTYEINNLRCLNDYLSQTIAVLACAQRLQACTPAGLSHSTFGPNVFGGQVPQGIDPRQAEFGGVGLSHSPYTYPYGLQGQQFGQVGVGGPLPTFVDPFIAQRGLSHSTGWSQLAEIQRQRELSALLAQRQYEAMWRGYMGV
jgi:hypothetical protein